jgi:hypothetical protein
VREQVFHPRPVIRAGGHLAWIQQSNRREDADVTPVVP